MNAGAHGGEFSQIARRVTLLTAQGELCKVKAIELDWRYRHSGIPEGAIVLEVEIELVPGDKEGILKKRAECLAERKLRQPLSLPSFGSVFKNPEGKLSAGAILEQCGMKGFTVGQAQVSEMHANWIVNPGRAGSTNDVLEIIKKCQEVAREKFGVELGPEVRVF